ncbi:ATP synthase protein I [Vulcaniibacterium tengchongense]|uniref:ATP synthase protein I n=1 Tax=Vulcaniibacterium tengchongense TaxID=1273429 RepID=A0A3N4V0Z0_9GAMM|nr:ATP synthase protein I [Vulcaniibacterium tengchongense]
MHDPLSAGRRLASRATAWQAGATALAALAFLPLGAPSALAAAVGGGALVLGSAVAGLIAFAGGVAPAGWAVGRLVAGTVSKWVVVLAALALGLAVLKLPPLPLLTGVLAALVALALAATRR